MDLTDIALVFTANNELAILDRAAARYFEALAAVRAEYASLHHHAATRTNTEREDALGTFNELMAAAAEAAADFGLPDFHMGHVIGTH